MKRKIGNTTIDILPPVKRYMNAIERRLRVDRPNAAAHHDRAGRGL